MAIKTMEKERLIRNLAEAEIAVINYGTRLERVDIGARIDEVALLVEDHFRFSLLHEGLEEEGWQLFNEARDTVRTGPIRSLYSVRYTFYRHPDKDWRLEVMRLEEGVSPLHAAILPPLKPGLCVPVHASFKVPTEEDYAYARTALENGLHLEEAQRCDSTYGRFSYWTDLSRLDVVPYLKPRVNLRDA